MDVLQNILQNLMIDQLTRWDVLVVYSELPHFHADLSDFEQQMAQKLHTWLGKPREPRDTKTFVHSDVEFRRL